MLNSDCLLQQPCKGCSSKHLHHLLELTASVSHIYLVHMDYCYHNFRHAIHHTWKERPYSMYWKYWNFTTPADDTDLPVALATHLQTPTLRSMCQICEIVRIIIQIQIMPSCVPIRMKLINLHRSLGAWSLAPTLRIKAQGAKAMRL